MIEKAGRPGPGRLERANQCAVIDRFAVKRAIKPPPDQLEDFFEICRCPMWARHTAGERRIKVRVAAYKAWHKQPALKINDLITGPGLQGRGSVRYIPPFDPQVGLLDTGRTEGYYGCTF